ncbi:MAG: hypothetical protein JWQ34_2717 [Mucilaginibacter sp.]|uniref:right-handed parallel beta-helix repeat-containing protein n=1 Tax=Mucilaginibacter sp. TaxID=1882438 RepID=UPI002613B752|nr:right-handed parallel beta-helix repeat-containing protein [Mucilaginibacter sp.]MDB5004492.1 hypothetical protein [Mucilaginibacter sp.]
MVVSILVYIFQLTSPKTELPSIFFTTVIVNVKDHGAKGDYVHDDTQAIINSIKFAKANGISTVYLPAGIYAIKQQGIKAGVIPLLNGVSLRGAGAKKCHIKLSGNRYNPSSIFYQAWWDEPIVSNIVIQGIDFDGNQSKQQFDPLYQYCHALSINNGENIEIKNCKFQSFRGDGVLFGDTFLPTPDLRLVKNVKVHDNIFYDIYREGAMFCCVNQAAFYNNYLHGNGFFVGGVDIERHSVNETVLNVSVYGNTFDFSDGFGPAERGGPIVKYRRAITMGFFYKGYKNKIADGRSGGHHIYNNKIFQGQIDCWGHTNITINNNTFENTYENIDGVNWLTPSAINVSDPAATIGLKTVIVSNNVIKSRMKGNGILFYNYSNISATGNLINGTLLDGINIYFATGDFRYNLIKNVGSPLKKVAGIVINGNSPGLILSNNTIIDTNPIGKQGINYAIAIQSKNDGSPAPKIYDNTGVNIINDVVKEFGGQLGDVDQHGNKKTNR